MPNENLIFLCQYPLHPNHKNFPQYSLIWNTIYTYHITCCSLYQYLTVWDTCLLGNPKRDIIIHGSIISIFISPAGFYYESQIKNQSGATYTAQALSTYDPSNTTIFIFEVHLIFNVWNVRSGPFAILWLQLWWVPQHEILYGCDK